MARHSPPWLLADPQVWVVQPPTIRSHVRHSPPSGLDSQGRFALPEVGSVPGPSHPDKHESNTATGGHMTQGPRDWNPPGYWDERPHQAAAATPGLATQRSTSHLKGLLAVLFGLASCWLPLSLPPEGSGYRGWMFTTVGISAIGWAIAAKRARTARGESAGMLPFLGGTLGVVGTILCLWSVVAFYSPGTLPPVPQLAALTGSSLSATPQPPPGAATSSSPSPSPSGARIVAPIEGANVTAPAQQLSANVRHVAIALCVGISSTKQIAQQYPGRFAGVPLTLTVRPDRLVIGGTATYSKLPADMTLDYTGTPDGIYSLTVRDAQSGIGVGCDSTSNRIIDR